MSRSERPHEIRRADETDVLALAALVSAFGAHLEEELRAESIPASLRRLLRDPGADLLLARDGDGRALGYAQLRTRYSLWVAAPESELEDLFVDAPARATGVGTALVQAAIARARERGARVLHVSTNERNAPALRLYDRAGFAAERARWDGGRQLWLKRELTPLG